jgi:hypothetical protein
MRTRTRIHPYLVPDIARRLTAYCAAKGLTESAAVQAAVEQYLDGGEREGALILRRLDRLGRASAQHQRDLEILSEAFAVFFRLWAMYVPNYSDTEMDTASRRAGRLFDEYVGIVSRELAAGSRLASRVMKNTEGSASGNPAPRSPPPPAGAR